MTAPKPANRKMARPWFTASNRSTTMGFLIPKEGDIRAAPLRDGERFLGRFVLPAWQRPPVWSQEQQIRFIESAWGGLPLGTFTYNQAPSYDSPYDAYLLDGQQRITAIYAYMDDEFPVLGFRYSELTEVDHRFWTMSCLFGSMMVQYDEEEPLREIYDRLAYGGTPHEPKE